MATQAAGNILNCQGDSADPGGRGLAPTRAARIRGQNAAGSPKSPIVFFLVFYFLLACGLFRLVPVYGSALQLKMHDDLLSLSAVEVDLDRVLQRLSEATGIDFRLSKDLNKKVTLQLSDVRLETALKRILEGLNYAMVYSVARNGDAARISEIYIYGKREKGGRISPSAPPEEMPGRRISDYEKRIEVMRQRLQEASPDSPAGRRYQKAIENYQRLVEKLKLQK